MKEKKMAFPILFPLSLRKGMRAFVALLIARMVHATEEHETLVKNSLANQHWKTSCITVFQDAVSYIQ